MISRFHQALSADRLGQAYLFLGPEGVGKESTALEIGRMVNCADPDGCRPDAPCESCRKAATFQHPDIRWIGPAPASFGEAEIGELLQRKQENPFYQAPQAATSRIVIGDPDSPSPLSVRSLLRFLRVKPFQGRFKVAVVSDAHRMNAAAANSFLKTLEEPPPDSLIFLLSTNRTGILPTILSRCQQVRFQPWDEDTLADLLCSLREVDRDTALAVARESDGNGRKALALMEPQTAALRNWAHALVGWIHAGHEAPALMAADQLHGGIIPADMVPEHAGGKLAAAKDLAGKRERGLQLCEMLELYYSELLNCRARERDWKPRLVSWADAIGATAARRRSRSLLDDIAALEEPKSGIDRTLNIGLTMAVLFQRLIDHAQADQEPVGS